MKKNNTLQVSKSVFAIFMALVFSFLTILPLGTVNYAQAASSSEIRKKIDALDDKIDQYQEELDAVNKKKSDAKKSASSLQSEIDTYQKQIDAYNDKISALNSEVSALNSEISDLESDISKLQTQIDAQNVKIQDTQTLLADRLRANYVAGNVTNLELLLEADSFTTFLNRLEMIARISKHDNAIIDQLKDEIAGVKEDKADLEKQEAQLQANKQSINSAKSEQESAKAAVVNSKSQLDTKMSTLDNYISELDDSSSELQSYIDKAEAQQQAFMNSLNASVSQKASTGSGKVTNSSGSMTWPVPYSSSYISSGYGYRSLGSSSSFHYGIDITMPGADSYDKIVVAADDGTIVTASNICSHNYRKSSNCGCNGGYGNYVVIDNGDGLLIYYGHLTRATVSVGQKVSAGQTVGIMGCSGYSTGPHLHFEIRVNDGSSRSAAARNPLNYVSH